MQVEYYKNDKLVLTKEPTLGRYKLNDEVLPRGIFGEVIPLIEELEVRLFKNDGNRETMPDRMQVIGADSFYYNHEPSLIEGRVVIGSEPGINFSIKLRKDEDKRNVLIQNGGEITVLVVRKFAKTSE